MSRILVTALRPIYGQLSRRSCLAVDRPGRPGRVTAGRAGEFSPARICPSRRTKVLRGFRHQEAPQAHGEEEAPQAAEEDARAASQQEVADAAWLGWSW